MKRSFCSIAYKNTERTIFDILPEISEAGYDGVEIWWPHIEKLTDDELRDVRARAESLNLDIPMISPYLGNFNLEMTNADEMRKRMTDASRVANVLGVKLLRAFVGWTCECSSLTATDEYWEYNIRGFQEMAKIAESNDQYIAMETHGKTLVDSVSGCRKMLNAVGERAKINLQIDDIVQLSDLPDALQVYRALKEHVVHSHLNLHGGDDDGNNQDIKSQLRAMYAEMAADGFPGFISWEHCSGKGDPADALKAGMSVMDDLGI